MRRAMLIGMPKVAWSTHSSRGKVSLTLLWLRRLLDRGRWRLDALTVAELLITCNGCVSFRFPLSLGR